MEFWVLPRLYLIPKIAQWSEHCPWYIKQKLWQSHEPIWTPQDSKNVVERFQINHKEFLFHCAILTFTYKIFVHYEKKCCIIQCNCLFLFFVLLLVFKTSTYACVASDNQECSNIHMYSLVISKPSKPTFLTWETPNKTLEITYILGWFCF